MHINEMPVVLRTTSYGARKLYNEMLEALGITGKVAAISTAIERCWTDRGHRRPEIEVVQEAVATPRRASFYISAEVKTDKLRFTSFGELASFAR